MDEGSDLRFEEENKMEAEIFGQNRGFFLVKIAALKPNGCGVCNAAEIGL